MHASILVALAALSSSSSAAAITALDAAQSKAILSAWSQYSATVAFGSGVASLVQAVATGVPSSDIASTTAATTTSVIDLVSYINHPPAISTPSWVSVLPATLAKPYMQLQHSAENEMVRLAKEAATGTVTPVAQVAAASTTLPASDSSLLVSSVATSAASAISTSAASAISTITTAGPVSMTSSGAVASVSSADSSVAAVASGSSAGAAAAPTGQGIVKIAGMAVGAMGAAVLLL